MSVCLGDFEADLVDIMERSALMPPCRRVRSSGKAKADLSIDSTSTSLVEGCACTCLCARVYVICEKKTGGLCMYMFMCKGVCNL
jgi:hypothetical protein